MKDMMVVQALVAACPLVVQTRQVVRLMVVQQLEVLSHVMEYHVVHMVGLI